MVRLYATIRGYHLLSALHSGVGRIKCKKCIYYHYHW